MVNGLIILLALGIGAVLLIPRRLARSDTWRATGTPLASIMGSGFLVCAPLLHDTVGNYAVFAMGGLLVVAYLVGGVIRFNIANAEPIFESKHEGEGDGSDGEHRLHLAHAAAALLVHWKGLVQVVEKLSHVALAGAYVISVTYYLQLLAVFLLKPLGIQDGFVPKIVTTVILSGIGVVGTIWGLSMMERIERYVLSINLAMIGALIAGLVWHNVAQLLGGSWSLAESHVDASAHGVRVLMGLLIVVQGFETSRFLGSEHSAKERVRTMRYAQLISTGVYIAFIALVTPLFGQLRGSTSADVTAIVNIGGIVAVVLPALILIAAAGSQFSAAVADDAGCAGLIQAVIRSRVPKRAAYAFIAGATIALTWVTDVLQVISLASRAFALFYTLQCVVACITAAKIRPRAWPARTILFAVLAIVCAAITVLGIPAE